jgi:hypothetical protein
VCRPLNAFALGVMKKRYLYVVLALALLLGGYVALRVHNHYGLQNYNEARSFDIEVKVRAPVYEKSTYPYGTQSPPNPIVGYIEIGSKPDVQAITYDKPSHYWEVRLDSGKTGYLFAPDVEVRGKRTP